MTGGEHSASEKVPTTYVVLAQEPPRDNPNADMGALKGEVWREVGRYEARTATTAIRQHASKGIGKDGTFVAVPERSWAPVKVETKTETKLVIEAAS